MDNDRQCYRSDGWPKRRYLSRRDARKSARDVRKRDMQHYRCPQCGFWHIGHRTERT